MRHVLSLLVVVSLTHSFCNLYMQVLAERNTDTGVWSFNEKAEGEPGPVDATSRDVAYNAPGDDGAWLEKATSINIVFEFNNNRKNMHLLELVFVICGSVVKLCVHFACRCGVWVCLRDPTLKVACACSLASTHRNPRLFRFAYRWFV